MQSLHLQLHQIRFNKRNSQEKLHHPILSLLGKLHHLLHQYILREFIGVINLTSVRTENSWGINCVILEGPKVPLGPKLLHYITLLFRIDFSDDLILFTLQNWF